MACRRAPQMKGSSLGTKITEEADLGLKIGHSKAFLKSEDVGQTLDLSIRGSRRELYIKLANMFDTKRAKMLNNALYQDEKLFWNFWKDEIVNILRYLGGSVKKYSDYKEVCLSYLGVLKQFNKRTSLYFVLYLEADWA
ncbi:hypothetical protein PVL29_021633 [Vitis rotundifolia]|uniref:Uncharacterized protein n=1 Tax=Vitis rotundifolia TaxID=103349 RepID=A0AA39DCC3_VITRO|nr:hypothetical protein PVL29_021633 [Vitis rotundifolia]